MKKDKIAVVIIIVILVIFYINKQEIKTIEDYNIPSGFGGDIQMTSKDQVKYSIPYSIYNFKEEGTGIITTGKGNTIGDTREDRQLKSGRAYVIGLQKILIYSERVSKFGLKSNINVVFSNPKMNDRSKVVICKGKPVDILRHKVKGYPTSSDYIEGMVKNLNKNNFFTDKYTLMDMYINFENEGHNVVLPYLELVDDELKFTGIAAFKGYKMAYKLNIDESKIMNILRENNVTGILTVQEGSKKYINYLAKSKRKVKCKREGDKYNFNIYLKLNGDIISNQLYKVIDENTKKKFEEQMKNKLEKDCNDFINKMQSVYNMDFLQLGAVAAAKYGRDTGVDWNKIVCNSNIKVNIKVNVDKAGRGDY